MVTLWSFRVALGAAFVASAIGQLRQPFEFLRDVYGYELLGLKSGMWFAMVTPWLELTLGASLLAGVYSGGAFLGASVLLGIFAVAQALAMIRGLSINCGCHLLDTETAQVGFGTLLRTLGFLILGLTGCMLHARDPVHLNEHRATVRDANSARKDETSE